MTRIDVQDAPSSRLVGVVFEGCTPRLGALARRETTLHPLYVPPFPATRNQPKASLYSRAETSLRALLRPSSSLLPNVAACCLLLSVVDAIAAIHRCSGHLTKKRTTYSLSRRRSLFRLIQAFLQCIFDQCYPLQKSFTTHRVFSIGNISHLG